MRESELFFEIEKMSSEIKNNQLEHVMLSDISSHVISTINGLDSMIDKTLKNYVHHALPAIPSVKFPLKREHLFVKTRFPKVYFTLYDVLPVFLIELGIIRGIRTVSPKVSIRGLTKIKHLEQKKNQYSKIHKLALGTFITYDQIESLDLSSLDSMLLLWSLIMHMVKPLVYVKKGFSAIFASPLSLISATQRGEISYFSLFASISILDFTKSKIRKYVLMDKKIECIEARCYLPVYSRKPQYEHALLLTSPIRVFIPCRLNILFEGLLPSVEEFQQWFREKYRVITNVLYMANLNKGLCLVDARSSSSVKNSLIVIDKLPFHFLASACINIGKLDDAMKISGKAIPVITVDEEDLRQYKNDILREISYFSKALNVTVNELEHKAIWSNMLRLFEQKITYKHRGTLYIMPPAIALQIFMNKIENKALNILKDFIAKKKVLDVKNIQEILEYFSSFSEAQRFFHVLSSVIEHLSMWKKYYMSTLQIKNKYNLMFPL